MLLARCYNNEGLENLIEVGQYVDVIVVAEGVYQIYKRSNCEFLLYIETPNFEKHFEVMNIRPKI